jgi:hypothetical protein
MKTKAEILETLRKVKLELVPRDGLKRLAFFGSNAREDQREERARYFGRLAGTVAADFTKANHA